MVCESYSTLENGKKLLYLALEIGFRHISQIGWIGTELIHLNSHQQMVDIVFQSQESETIADFLCAWTSRSDSHDLHPSLEMCASHLINLHHLQPSSPRLRKLLIHSIELIGHQGFEQVGVEGVIRLLDGLNLHVEDINHTKKMEWGNLLLDAIQSPDGTQKVPHPYWELLVEIVAKYPWMLEKSACDPHIMTSLEAAKEWDKLECWMGVIWISWIVDGLRESGDEEVEVEEDFRRATLSLFHKQPDAIQKLESWMKRGATNSRPHYKSFQQICDQAHLEMAPQLAQYVLVIIRYTSSLTYIHTLLRSSNYKDGETVQATHSRQPSLPLGFGDNTF